MRETWNNWHFNAVVECHHLATNPAERAKRAELVVYVVVTTDEPAAPKHVRRLFLRPHHCHDGVPKAGQKGTLKYQGRRDCGLWHFYWSEGRK